MRYETAVCVDRDITLRTNQRSVLDVLNRCLRIAIYKDRKSVRGLIANLIMNKTRDSVQIGCILVLPRPYFLKYDESATIVEFGAQGASPFVFCQQGRTGVTWQNN